MILSTEIIFFLNALKFAGDNIRPQAKIVHFFGYFFGNDINFEHPKYVYNKTIRSNGEKNCFEHLRGTKIIWFVLI